MNFITFGFIEPFEILIILGILLFLGAAIVLTIILIVRATRKKHRQFAPTYAEPPYNKTQPEESEKETQVSKEHFPVKDGSKIALIPFHEIVDFSIDNNYIFLTDAAGNNHLVESNLVDLEEKLPTEFIRVHKSSIINSKRIEKLNKLANGRFEAQMKCQKERIIICSKNYKEKIKELIEF